MSDGVDGVLAGGLVGALETVGVFGVVETAVLVVLTDTVERAPSDFVEADGRNVGVFAAAAVLGSDGLAVVALAAAIDALLARDVRLAEGVTTGCLVVVVVFGTGGTSGTAPGATVGARDFELDADIVRVRGATGLTTELVLTADIVR